MIEEPPVATSRRCATMLLAALFALSVLALPAPQEPAPALPTSDARIESPLAVAPPSAAAPEDFAAVARRCEHIEASVARGALDELDTAVDYAALLERALAGLDPDEQFVANSLAQMSLEQAPWPEIVAQIRENDGSFHFLRVLPTLPLRALFRNTNDLGINYYEFEFARDATGALRIVDFYSYATAVRVQSMVRDFALPLIPNLKFDDRGRLTGRDGAMVRAPGRIKRIREKQIEDPAAALELFDSLSVDIRYEPSFLLWRLQIASRVSLEEYGATIDEFVKRHPDSPALPLVLIDHHLLREEWDAALAAIDRVEAIVGGDPYLDITRAHVQGLAKRFDEAIARAERALAADPRIALEALWAIVGLALASGDHDTVFTALVRIDEHSDREWNDLTQDASYAEFVKSPQYQQWLRHLAEKANR